MKTVAQFAIAFEQLLGPDGVATAALPPFAKDAAQLVKMYRMMALCRMFDAKAINLQRTGKLGTYAPCTGHEATHVGVGAAMRTEDVLFPVYREYGTQLWRGVTLTEILTYWAGDESGTNFSVPREDFPWCVPIGSQVPHAAGAAMAFKIRGQARCAVAYVGDGGTSQGAFYEALNLAGAQRLPMVFVIVNNGWAISVPASAQTGAETFAQKGIAGGVPGVQVDGNDVIAVRAITEAALDRARRGEGATVIEAITYRLSDHTTADDATRYRPAAQVAAAWKVEPMLRTRAYLESLGFWNESMEAAMRTDHATAIDIAVRAYQERHIPGVEVMFDYLFANPPAGLAEQRDAALHAGPPPQAH
ncbi:MAG: pyruvate dehydrogenase (acetyl-transferring) E1 component subunit alpha [Pseudomonadota bacterium]